MCILAIAKDPARADRTDVNTATAKVTASGHRVVAERVVADTESAIRPAILEWMKAPEVDVVIVLGGDSDAISTALKPLVTEHVPGFTDLFRWMMFQEKGAAAMLAPAEAAKCGTTFVFVVPGAVASTLDKLILPQFDATTTQKTLVNQLPRLQTESEPWP